MAVRGWRPGWANRSGMRKMIALLLLLLTVPALAAGWTTVGTVSLLDLGGSECGLTIQVQQPLVRVSLTNARANPKTSAVVLSREEWTRFEQAVRTAQEVARGLAEDSEKTLFTVTKQGVKLEVGAAKNMEGAYASIAMVRPGVATGRGSKGRNWFPYSFNADATRDLVKLLDGVNAALR